MTLITIFFLLLVILSAAISSIGIVIARDEFDRLHYLGPITVVGGLAIFFAVFTYEGFSQMTGKVAVASFILIVTGPVLTHSISRAGLNRGDAKSLRDEDWEVIE